jgi:putative endonuclease
MAAKDELGRAGEDLAVEAMERAGLIVISRNWRCSEGELDIVATDQLKQKVIFCEVKTRRGPGFGSPFESVTVAKRRKIRRLAQLWLQAHGTPWKQLRFDVAGVTWPADEEPVIEYRAEAF